jgi:hypothetical protein
VQQDQAVTNNLLEHAGKDEDLAQSRDIVLSVLTARQQMPGYWLTSHTDEPRFDRARVEMNTFVNSMMIDILNPVAKAVGLEHTLQRTRHYLANQIEAEGLVRYHGRPEGPIIGTLGCAITPDTDDTALVWRIAPSPRADLLSVALATLRLFRTSDGLYRTWLAPIDRYECIDRGKDPNPADVGIQMHVFMLLAQVDPAAAQALCGTLMRVINKDRIWIYYQTAPLIPILRQIDLQSAGCPVQLPISRLQVTVPGQDIWVTAAQLLGRVARGSEHIVTSAEVIKLLRTLAQEKFLIVRQSPPLLYHNDFTASVRRFYWSEELGYALWLRLYFEYERLRLSLPMGEPAVSDLTQAASQVSIAQSLRRIVSCIRFDEVAVLQGSPAVGAIIAMGALTMEKVGALRSSLLPIVASWLMFRAERLGWHQLRYTGCEQEDEGVPDQGGRTH